MIGMESIITPKQIFFVFTKDGKSKIVLAVNEEDIPGTLDDISFAASLEEMKGMVGDMESIMALQIGEKECILTLKQQQKGDGE